MGPAPKARSLEDEMRLSQSVQSLHRSNSGALSTQLGTMWTLLLGVDVINPLLPWQPCYLYDNLDQTWQLTTFFADKLNGTYGLSLGSLQYWHENR